MRTTFTQPLLAAAAATLVLQACAVARRGPVRDAAPDRVWAWHGQRNPHWIEISESAADAHRRHGDRISRGQHRQGASCRPD